jgi:hypothetical protein
MKITIKELRRIINDVLMESGGGTTLPRSPMIRNAMAPEMADREQLGKISRDNDPDAISSHLEEPTYEFEDCYGPVPPTNKNPYALPDPYTKDTSPLPTSPIKR